MEKKKGAPMAPGTVRDTPHPRVWTGERGAKRRTCKIVKGDLLSCKKGGKLSREKKR